MRKSPFPLLFLLLSSVFAFAQSQTVYNQTNLPCVLQSCGYSYGAPSTPAQFAAADTTTATLRYKVTSGNVYGTNPVIGGYAEWNGVTYNDMAGTVVYLGPGAPHSYTNRYALVVSFNGGKIALVENVNVTCYRGCTQHDQPGSTVTVSQ